MQEAFVPSISSFTMDEDIAPALHVGMAGMRSPFSPMGMEQAALQQSQRRPQLPELANRSRQRRLTPEELLKPAFTGALRGFDGRYQTLGERAYNYHAHMQRTRLTPPDTIHEAHVAVKYEQPPPVLTQRPLSTSRQFVVYEPLQTHAGSWKFLQHPNNSSFHFVEDEHSRLVNPTHHYTLDTGYESDNIVVSSTYSSRTNSSMAPQDDMSQQSVMQLPVTKDPKAHSRMQRSERPANASVKQPVLGDAQATAGGARASPAAASVISLSSASNANDSQITLSDSDTPQTPEAQPSAPQDYMSIHAGLFARERNPRRPATKLYREVPTPPKPGKRRTPKATKANKESLVVRLPTPPVVKGRNKRPASEGGVQETPPKKRRTTSARVAKVGLFSNSSPVAATQTQSEAPINSRPVDSEPRPERDELGDRKFVAEVLEVLEERVRRKTPDFGRRQADRISTLLRKAEYPGKHQAWFLSTTEAKEAVASGKFFNGPIVTTDQQTLPLHTVKEFLDEYYEDNAEVWIQDPSVRPTKGQPIVRKVKMKAIKTRFAADKPNPQPWNCLELATHCDDGLRPAFLNTEDCRLLTKLKIPDSADAARRRVYEAGYKEVEKWALLAQAGALTEPHQDSHGYSTFITVNVGLVGFGWLSLPNEQVRAEWRRDPMNYTGGNWRYIVLKPGQTVYFPAGTVHFVFRLPSAGDTLAFGGHILRCSNIVHWVKTLIEERDQSGVTNEDLTDSATGYLERVEKFVKQAVGNGTAEKWGGVGSIEEFLRLKEEFGRLKQRQ